MRAGSPDVLADIAISHGFVANGVGGAALGTRVRKFVMLRSYASTLSVHHINFF
jgi:hypothetical protein